MILFLLFENSKNDTIWLPRQIYRYTAEGEAEEQIGLLFRPKIKVVQYK